MGARKNILFGAIFLLIAFSYQTYHELTKAFPKPEIDLDEYWGPGDGRDHKDSAEIKPFKISIPDDVIKRLSNKINDTQAYTDPLENTACEYGFNGNSLRKILTYWKDEYLPKWKEHEAFLNQFPQYKTEIQGLDIHFIHIKPKVGPKTKVYKLLMLHGWPGSVREYYDVIPMLINPSKDDIAFEVVVASLPGYAWSEASAKQGLGTYKMSIVFRNLMVKLGLDKFYIHGGDWGALIGSSIATMFPENVLGYHSHMCGINTPMASIRTIIASFYPSYFIEEEKIIDWIYPAIPKIMDLLQEASNVHIQGTKPDTIGVALRDNPAGLAAYILERFSTWTKRDNRDLIDGGLEKHFSLDALLDNLMIYYLSSSITTAVRLEKEFFRELSVYSMDRIPTDVPTGCSNFKHALLHQPPFILKEKFRNIIYSAYHDQGGHFPAMELPKIFYDSILEYFRKVK